MAGEGKVEAKVDGGDEKSSGGVNWTEDIGDSSCCASRSSIR